MNRSTGMFHCDICTAVLEDNAESEISIQSQETLSQLMEQCTPILNALKQTDSLILPQPTPFDKFLAPDFEYNENKDEDSKLGGDDQQGENDPKSLSLAKDTGMSTGQILVEFDCDLSPDQVLAEKEKKIEQKLEQNALPPWHVWSTVSGTQMVPDSLISPRMLQEHNKRKSKHTKEKNHTLNNHNSKDTNKTESFSETTLDSDSYYDVGIGVNNAEGNEKVSLKRKKEIEQFYTNYYEKIMKRTSLVAGKKRSYQEFLTLDKKKPFSSENSPNKEVRYFDDVIKPNGIGKKTEEINKENSTTNHTLENKNPNEQYLFNINTLLFRKFTKESIDNKEFVQVDGNKKPIFKLRKSDIKKMTDEEYSKFWNSLFDFCNKYLQNRNENGRIDKSNLDTQASNLLLAMINCK
ncbi:hypothetical protein BB560_002333 [Smittium megazygosporum]|uniref:Uncharacterized protein n=1 Tax=Smittium megazygosporum TaxID=133381 RepID=A0A2T9ZF28_9FUNG|nr:hypothetical protein BB560_002333 [Smittium megazygosporum]